MAGKGGICSALVESRPTKYGVTRRDNYTGHIQEKPFELSASGLCLPTLYTTHLLVWYKLITPMHHGRNPVNIESIISILDATA